MTRRDGTTGQDAIVEQGGLDGEEHFLLKRPCEAEEKAHKEEEQQEKEEEDEIEDDGEDV